MKRPRAQRMQSGECRPELLVTVPGIRVLPFALIRLVLVLGLSLGLLARAHSPFDSSTRMFVMDDGLELVLTTGMERGAALLQGAPSGAFQTRPVGPFFPLSLEFAARFFEVFSGGAPWLPRRVGVRTDGLEWDLVIEYPRPAGGALEVNAVYAAELGAAAPSAFVMTDDRGNILATRVVSRENHSFDITLPVVSGVAPTVLPARSDTALSVPPPGTAAGIAPAAPPPNPGLGLRDFLLLGIRHILTGYDHLLFLCGLLVVCRRVGPALAIITCFTLAHSITLALAALDLVQISPRFTEPLIAATIVLVGIENIRGAVSIRMRCGLALAFGLIHGFGFATALRESGLGGTGWALVPPLLSFNLGVECGQLALAALFLPFLFALQRIPWFGRHGAQAISWGVVLLGGYWLLERTLFTVRG